MKAIIVDGGLLFNLPLWFLMVLTMCNVYTSMVKISKIVLLTSIFGFVLCLMNVNLILPKWWPFIFINAYVFYGIGYFSRKIDALHIIRKMNGLHVVCIFSVLTMLAISNGYTDMKLGINGKSYLLYVVCGILGTILQLIIGFKCSDTIFGKRICNIGRYSHWILVSHYYLCRGIIPLLINYYNVQWLSLNVWFNIMITVILMSIYCFLFYEYEKRKNINFLLLKK